MQLVFLLLLAIPAVGIGLALGMLFLPLLQTIAAYPFFYRLVRDGAWGQAFLSFVAWAAFSALLVGLLSCHFGDFVQSRIFHGAAYRDEMVEWIETGKGTESDPNRFIPQHILHLAFFAGLTLISAGFLGLAMGAGLLNYMAFYVGDLLSRAGQFWAAAFLLWPPWAALRVLGYILLAIGLTGVSLHFARGAPANWSRVGKYAGSALLLLIADAALKWALAPVWQRMLQKIF